MGLEVVAVARNTERTVRGMPSSASCGDEMCRGSVKLVCVFAVSTMFVKPVEVEMLYIVPGDSCTII